MVPANAFTFHRRGLMTRLATILTTAFATMTMAMTATSSLADYCPVSRMIPASGTATPGMPAHIYYIYPESGEIQEGLNEPEPAAISCQGGTLILQKKDSVGNVCEFRFRFNSTNTGAALTEAAPANCATLQLTNLKWAAPIASRMTERKM